MRNERTRVQKEYARALESKLVEGDEGSDIEHTWEQVKLVMVASAIGIHGSVRV